MRRAASFRSASASSFAMGWLVVAALATGRAAVGMPVAIAADAMQAVPAIDSPPLEAPPVAEPAEAPPPQPAPPLRVLPLQLLGTNDRVDLMPLEASGAPREEGMAELAWMFAPASLRAPGSERVPPDLRLVDLLIRISEEIGGKPLILVSGHRTAGRGTGHRSYHVKGMAADIAASGLKPIELRKAALKAGARGVGYYPGFVHVDVRDEPYRWSNGGSRRH